MTIAFLACSCLFLASPPDTAPRTPTHLASAAETAEPTTVPTGEGAAAGASAVPGFAEGRTAGERDAASIPTLGWTAGGFAGGCVLGPPGCLGVAAGGYFSDAGVPRHALVDTSDEFQRGYREGYTTRSRDRKGKAALLGGLAGTVFVTAAVFWAFAVPDDEKSNAFGAIRPAGFEF